MVLFPVLSQLTPVRGLVGLFVLTVVLATWPRRAPTDDWQAGLIQYGSLRAEDGGYTFILLPEAGNRCVGPRLEVHLDGPLADTVCEGAEVVVSGTGRSHHVFEARRVLGFNHGRYDPCWRLRCDRAAYHQCHGDRFE